MSCLCIEWGGSSSAKGSMHGCMEGHLKEQNMGSFREMLLRGSHCQTRLGHWLGDLVTSGRL